MVTESSLTEAPWLVVALVDPDAGDVEAEACIGSFVEGAVVAQGGGIPSDLRSDCSLTLGDFDYASKKQKKI